MSTRTRHRVPAWTVSDRLRKAREYAGLEQRQLAERSGLSRQTVSNAERGVVTPQRTTMRLWAEVTGVPLSWLVDGVEPAHRQRRARLVVRTVGMFDPQPAQAS